MVTTNPDLIYDSLNSIVSLNCWYISTGGAAGSTFHMAFGRKKPREILLKNDAHSQEFRENQGEVELYVWCAWRLDSSEKPIVSWDQKNTTIDHELNRLVGEKIIGVKTYAPAWDLEITFSNSLILRIFSDHLPDDHSFDGNWEVVSSLGALNVGPGNKWEFVKNE